MSDILIKNVEIITEKNNEIFNIGIKEQDISYVGKDIPEGFHEADVIDGKNL